MGNDHDALHPYGELDVLGYYSEVAKLMAGFLNGKEIATKTFLKNFFFLRRGSNSEPLFITDLQCVDEKMLEMRKGHSLEEKRKELAGKQELVWHYFVPRKMINLFYATNGEKAKGPIERIFIDIDRKNFGSETAQKVAVHLVEEIKDDKELAKLIKFDIFIMWTGSSFHVYLLLKKSIDLGFYEKYLSYGEKKESSFITKWAREISDKAGINVKAGHEKEKDAIILDSSNTPPGKLARCPFSLHAVGYGNYDGIAVPLSEEELKDKKLIGRLKIMTPQKILKNLESYRKLL